ncbi:hypothetical protein AeMF1_016657 [Aphanomyces euteiches]|nr:hypothetical protein AeMF1_016657 [Aphanomyces euteiches]
MSVCDSNHHITPPPETRSSHLATHDTLFRFTVDCRLKKTTGQRIDGADKLGLHLITANDWQSVKQRLWDICLTSLQPLATYSGEPTAWSLSNDTPSIENFEKYFAFRIETMHGARNLPMWQINQEAHKSLAKLRKKTITVSVYKWGNELSTRPQLALFTKMCIDPSRSDRSGAASEAEHQEVIVQMKSQWVNLTAPEMAWRIWANEICQMPEGQRSRAISKGPTQNIISLFRTASSTAHEHILRLKKNCRLALDLVDGAIQQLDTLRSDIACQRAIMDSRLNAFDAMLKSKKEVIIGYADDLDPRPDDIDVLRVLSTIPGQEDIDH